MNRPLSIREIRLLMILPALLILGVYAFAFERRYLQQLESVRNATAEASKNPVPASKLQNAHLEIASLTGQNEQEKTRVAAATQPSLVLPMYWTSSDGRLNALANVASTFGRNSVYVVQTSSQPQTAVSAIAPKPLQDFATAIAHEGHSPVPEIWKIELIGKYGDVLKSLDELGYHDSFIIPLGIQMESVGEGSVFHRWQVWIWV